VAIKHFDWYQETRRGEDPKWEDLRGVHVEGDNLENLMIGFGT